MNHHPNRFPGPGARFSMTELRSTSPVMQAVEGIDHMIASGRLSPGHRLVEEDLSAELGVPRGRVREALRILAGRGVVELAPYKSARVRRLPQSETRALHEIVTGLFSVALVLLAMHYDAAPDALKERFARISDEITRSAPGATMRRLIQLILEYHDIVNEMSGNPHLDRLTSGLQLGHYYEGITDHIPEETIRACFGNANRIRDLIETRRMEQLLSTLWSTILPMLASLQAAAQTVSPAADAPIG